MLSTYKQGQLDKSVQVLGKRLKKIGYLLLVLVPALVAIYLILAFNDWSQTHKIVIQTPLIVKVQSPVVIQTKNIKTTVANSPVQKVLAAEPTPMPLDEKAVVLAFPHGEVLWKIYQLESGRGKADLCRNEGRGYAGFGVLDSGKVVCYKSFEEATARAEYWLAKLPIDTDLEGALCSWNTGSSTHGCIYYKSYKSL